MSSDPYKESTPGFGGFNPSSSHAHPDQPQPFNNSVNHLPSLQVNPHPSPSENIPNYSQNQSFPPPNYSQNPYQNSNYPSSSAPMTTSNPSEVHLPSSSHQMAHPSMHQNQPSISQNAYNNQSYGQAQNYSQPMIGTPQQMQNLPPVGINTVGYSYNASGGEKTYEPGMPSQLNNSMPGAPSGIDKGLPLSPEVMKEFEEKSARGKQYKQTDVFPAILLKNEDDSIRVIKYLKEQGVDLKHVDTLEQTALFYAARDGKDKVVSFLLENGCNPNHRDTYGQTCIYYAAREDKMECAQKLIEAGADLNNEDMHQQTCLFYAAKQGNVDMCAKLIDNGANINHADGKRQTALHWAQKSRKAEMVDYLISRGASPISRKTEKKRQGTKKKPTNERKEPKKYVLTTFVNGQWLPLTDEDFARLEKECPEIGKIIKDPTELEKLEIPEIPDDVPIYDHWEKPAKRIIGNLWKHESAWLFQYPVDVKAWGIEDYYNIVKDPMDFTTIK